MKGVFFFVGPENVDAQSALIKTDIQEVPISQAIEEDARREAHLEEDRDAQMNERQQHREQERELQLQLEQLGQQLILQQKRKQQQREHLYSEDNGGRRKHKSRERYKCERSYERPKRSDEREERRHRSRETPDVKEAWDRREAKGRDGRHLTSRGSHSHSGSRERRKRNHIGHFLLTRTLGRGAFGTVYEAYDTQYGGTYAIKRVSLIGVSGAEKEIMHREIQLLQRLRHRHVVKYVGAIRGHESLNIILEYCQRGSVTNVLNKEFGKRTRPEAAVASCAYQVLLGLAYLHERGVIHRDIKGANILMNDAGVIKLADFGVATRLTGAQGVKTHSVVGTPYWMAPEIIQMNSLQSPACDVWSVGCTIIELLTGRPPFYDLNPMTALYQIVRSPHPPLPSNCSPQLLSFLHACFERDPAKRPTVHELLNHPWFSPSSAVPQLPSEFGLLPELEVLTPNQQAKLDSSSSAPKSRKSLGFDSEPNPAEQPGDSLLATPPKRLDFEDATVLDAKPNPVQISPEKKAPIVDALPPSPPPVGSPVIQPEPSSESKAPLSPISPVVISQPSLETPLLVDELHVEPFAEATSPIKGPNETPNQPSVEAVGQEPLYTIAVPTAPAAVVAEAAWPEQDPDREQQDLEALQEIFQKELQAEPTRVRTINNNNKKSIHFCFLYAKPFSRIAKLGSPSAGVCGRYCKGLSCTSNRDK